MNGNREIVDITACDAVTFVTSKKHHVGIPQTTRYQTCSGQLKLTTAAYFPR